MFDILEKEEEEGVDGGKKRRRERGGKTQRREVDLCSQENTKWNFSWETAGDFVPDTLENAAQIRLHKDRLPHVSQQIICVTAFFMIPLFTFSPPQMSRIRLTSKRQRRKEGLLAAGVPIILFFCGES